MFSFGLPIENPIIANLSNCPNGFKDIRKKIGRNLTVFCDVNLTGMPLDGGYWNIYISGYGTVNNVIAITKEHFYIRTYYDNNEYDSGWIALQTQSI